MTQREKIRPTWLVIVPHRPFSPEVIKNNITQRVALFHPISRAAAEPAEDAAQSTHAKQKKVKWGDLIPTQHIRRQRAFFCSSPIIGRKSSML